MAEEIPHFKLNFDFLYTQENENDISNEEIINVLLMWKRKRPKLQINGIVKVFNGRYTNYYRLLKI